MVIIGCNFLPGLQQIAVVATVDGYGGSLDRKHLFGMTSFMPDQSYLFSVGSRWTRGSKRPRRATPLPLAALCPHESEVPK